jgi:hypothetical protein
MAAAKPVEIDKIELVDIDATPVANRRLMVKDGVIYATDLANPEVEQRAISKKSVQHPNSYFPSGW